MLAATPHPWRSSGCSAGPDGSPAPACPGRGRRARGRGRRRRHRPGADRGDPRPGGRGRPVATGGGTVLETEAGGDGAAYGVEVRLPDGRQLEVTLDQSFKVVGQEPDEDDRPGP